MSSLFVVCGCAMQSRVSGGGLHGKIESNSATGSCAARPKVARGTGRHATLNSKTFTASNGAPTGPPLSWLPTNQFGVPGQGRRAHVQSVGAFPSPVLPDLSPGWRVKVVARAHG